METMNKPKKPSCFGANLLSSTTCFNCYWESECSKEAVKCTLGTGVQKVKQARISKDEYYLAIALAVSERSTCILRHYGAVIVKDDVIISTGYNGSPRGQVNCCDTGHCHRANCPKGTGYDLCPAVHAEQNAIICASRERMQGATLYLACVECDLVSNDLWSVPNPQPCSMCRKMIQNSGIERVVTRMGEIEWDL